MRTAVSPGGPQLEQRLAGDGIGEALFDRTRGDVEPVRPGIRGSAEDGAGRDQVEIGERQRLGAIEVDVDDFARSWAEDQPDIAARREVLGAELATFASPLSAGPFRRPGSASETSRGGSNRRSWRSNFVTGDDLQQIEWHVGDLALEASQPLAVFPID